MPTRLALALTTLCVGACFNEVDGPTVTTTERLKPCSLLGERKEVRPEWLEAFNPCCAGAAHFIPEMVIPEGVRGLLEAGPASTRCVPDELATQTKLEFPACKSLFGIEGACVTTCIPIVKQLYGGYPRSSCAAHQVCIALIKEVISVAEAFACGGKKPDGGATTDGGTSKGDAR